MGTIWAIFGIVRSGQYLTLGLFGLKPPVRDPIPSSQYLFWAEDFILGIKSVCFYAMRKIKNCTGMLYSLKDYF